MLENKIRQELPVPNNNLVSESPEIAYLAQKMGVTKEAVREAVKIVGSNSGYLEAYLKR